MSKNPTKSSRRNFLQHSLFGTTGLGMGIASTSDRLANSGLRVQAS